MKDTQQNVRSVAWVMPQGSDFRVLGVTRGGGGGGVKKKQDASKIFILGSN